MKTKEKTLHDKLCKKAATFLRKKHKCLVTVQDFNKTTLIENPDAWGINRNNETFLIEVKTSRNDFNKDKKKPHRQRPSEGLGMFRYYLCPYGLIQDKDLTANAGSWGLIWYNNNKLTVIKEPIRHVNDKFRDMNILLQVARCQRNGYNKEQIKVVR